MPLLVHHTISAPYSNIQIAKYSVFLSYFYKTPNIMYYKLLSHLYIVKTIKIPKTFQVFIHNT